MDRRIQYALGAAYKVLVEAGVPEVRLEAQLLLAHVLGVSRAFVLTHRHDTLPAVPHAMFRAYVGRRARREPFAYVVGRRAWLDLDLEVDRNVLIPRRETEQLAQTAIDVCRRAASIRAHPVIVDVGTGSGALAIAVARGCEVARVYATDSSAGALRVAGRNAARHAPGRVEILHGDLLEGVRERADLVVANLPYIPAGEIAALEPELAYEPRAALDGGADGLDAIRALFAQLPAHLADGAVVLLECGHDQARRVAALACAALPGARAEVRRDLAGVERFVHVYT